MRLLRSSLLKLLRRPATRRTLVILALLLAFIYLAIGASARAALDAQSRESIRATLEFPAAHGSLAGILLIFVGLAGAAYAGLVAGSEWGWGTFRVALARGESRVRYVIGLYVAVGLLALVGWVVLYALGLGLIILGGALGGIPAGNPLDQQDLGRFVALVAGGGWGILMEAAMGFSVAFVTRSPVAGITVMAGLYFVEQFAQLIVTSDIWRLAPITAASSLVSTAGDEGIGVALIGPLLVTAMYLFGAIGLACLFARRTEVA